MPLAVDTNVLARALVDDGSEQASRSRQCLLDNEVFIPDTVLLETEWLLRSRLKIPRETINELFSGLVSSRSAVFSDRSRLVKAMLGHRNGLDFADAMHLLASADCTAFATYDYNLIRRAGVIEGSVTAREP